MAGLVGKSWIITLLSLLALAGCQSKSGEADRDWAGEGREVLVDGGIADGASEGSANGWGIMIETFSGAGHVNRARQRRDEIARSLGREDVFVQVRSRGSVVVLGSYSGPKDSRAQRDLERIQSIQIGGRRPYERSYLTPPPPPPADIGNLPELNLLAARQMAGPKALYTLQVGVFESRRRDVSKRGAERYALELRQRGEAAFYYHGPTKSMVTIGIFGARAYDTQAQRVSLEVQSVQRRFPHNLMNGEDQIVEPNGSTQPSMLVLIPK